MPKVVTREEQSLAGMESKMSFPCYVYVHTNGTVHAKPAFVVDSIGKLDYFNSPYVVCWWHFFGKQNYELKKEEIKKVIEANKKR